MSVKILISVLFLQCITLILSQSQDSQAFKLINGKPDFCRDRDCPRFSVIKSFPDEFQVRKYYKSRWVTTRIVGVKLEESKRILFRRLFQYIAGNNQEFKKLSMTTPVLFKLLKAPRYGYLRDYSMSFYLPDSIPNPPIPRDNTVYIKEVPEFTAYTRSFPDFVRNKMKWVKEGKIMKKALKNQGLSHDESLFYAVTYDGPYELENRHNEVWLIAK